MRTKRRRGSAGIQLLEEDNMRRKRDFNEDEQDDNEIESKKSRTESEVAVDCGFFDDLPDDLLVSILCKLSSTAECPSDFFNSLLTCKRLKDLGFHKLVLLNASPNCFLAKANNWSESALQFLKLCMNGGNLEATYVLGMIRFYCLENRSSGASLMARAAINSHTQALYSLAVIHFNGSGNGKTDKKLKAAVALCARAASLGSIDALRELGHCLRDGYGVSRNDDDGRRLLLQANARELMSAISASSSSATTPPSPPSLTWHSLSATIRHGRAYGFDIPTPKPHPVNRFLVDWFAIRGGPAGIACGLKLCSHKMCGRPETRRNEFRRCSVCSAAIYCSRGCQTLDWKVRHKWECAAALDHPQLRLGGGNGNRGRVVRVDVNNEDVVRPNGDGNGGGEH